MLLRWIPSKNLLHEQTQQIETNHLLYKTPQSARVMRSPFPCRAKGITPPM